MLESIKKRKNKIEERINIKKVVFLVILLGLMILSKFRASGSLTPEGLLDKPVCFKVCPGSDYSSDFMEDIYASDIKIDLYQIGNIQYISKGDYYELFHIDKVEYDKLSKLNNVNINVMNYTASEWKSFSQEAVRIVFGISDQNKDEDFPDVKKTTDPIVNGVGLGHEIRDINPGLYLMVVRGSDLDSPDSYIKKSAEGDILTFSQSEKYEYTFEPELIVIPIWNIQTDNQNDRNNNIQKNEKTNTQNSTQKNEQIDNQNGTRKKGRTDNNNDIQSGEYAFLNSLKDYEESEDAYEIYLKTSRESKENTIGGSEGSSSGRSRENSEDKDYSYGSGGSSRSGDSSRSSYSDSSYSIAKTGDDNNILLYCLTIILSGLAGLLLFVFAICNKKRG